MKLEAWIYLALLLATVIGAATFATIQTRKRPAFRLRWFPAERRWWIQERSSVLFLSFWDSRFCFPADRLEQAREQLDELQRERDVSRERAGVVYYPTTDPRLKDLHGALSEPSKKEGS